MPGSQLEGQDWLLASTEPSTLPVTHFNPLNISHSHFSEDGNFVREVNFFEPLICTNKLGAYSSLGTLICICYTKHSIHALFKMSCGFNFVKIYEMGDVFALELNLKEWSSSIM